MYREPIREWDGEDDVGNSLLLREAGAQPPATRNL